MSRPLLPESPTVQLRALTSSPPPPSPSQPEPVSERIIPQPRRPRLYALDGLRLVAALAVVVFHFVGYDHFGYQGAWHKPTGVVFPTLHSIASYGWLGVEFFFLLSGFVICMSCWGRSVRDFAVSRVMRLYPAYWCCVLLTGVALRLNGDTTMTPERILTNLTMLHEPLGVGHVDPVYWSLWAEMRFYLIFSVVVLMGLTYQRVLGFCAIWLVGAVLAPASGLSLLVTLFQPTYAPFFVGGILMFLMYRFRPGPLLWLMLGASWLLAQHQLLILVNEEGGWSAHLRLSWTVGVALVTACYAVILAIALGRLTFLNRRWLVTAGALTYPLYLLHEELGWLVIGRLAGRVAPEALLAGVVLLMLLGAYLIHRLVERPLASRLKTWLTLPVPVRRGPGASTAA
ncbi:Peptidoglycan/LPS O-acetylase OafA/YrhL, contains acyltransferase and SGNH-hydrolase domains [Streptacidiphilus jiangxiensis]|uniref:Peptidoglycan/LPS O-acetylase OafA/YrhL, contains acyltransferase and SGNH-hydrolase domains n=1 Tax=Streptacidiphilus jiangxiensis TaxID=235985 RepID=A0A1H7L8Z8_STRJI|nr:Peptidoglycan/LPS O-acetylase OafA/YrhL, contains acyltransferase and SGNH-hydrolase domains [Streptacidiphilus jiangxiensis]